METRNARVENTMLGNEDHGVMVFYLHLDYGGTGQSFGGVVLDSPVNEGGIRSRIGTAFGLTAIMRVLEVLGVGKWEALPGTHCRVVADHSRVSRIGHILKDKWLDLTELAEEMGVGEED
jgi:hypothetical protein